MTTKPTSTCLRLRNASPSFGMVDSNALVVVEAAALVRAAADTGTRTDNATLPPLRRG